MEWTFLHNIRDFSQQSVAGRLHPCWCVGDRKQGHQCSEHDRLWCCVFTDDSIHVQVHEDKEQQGPSGDHQDLQLTSRLMKLQPPSLRTTVLQGETTSYKITGFIGGGGCADVTKCVDLNTDDSIHVQVHEDKEQQGPSGDHQGTTPPDCDLQLTSRLMKLQPPSLRTTVLQGETTSYKITGFIGGGGCADVTKCVDLNTGKEVAIKIQNDLAMFKKIRALDPDRHNIVTFIEKCQYGELPCLVFEMMDTSLSDLIEARERRALSVNELRSMTA
ncbi:uncharacterized protein LOC124850105 isoform X4 [Scophthalmus maximus]|uniref:uncharacterized protein LOC124850105 isoform X4 n=1 Tax=Scophthalmus maximus TaxID=52904 RepID=UPI001FA82EEE|nr:uncharacterized protein LOC124850105 isoform X4 [Scophthalmus maximus]